MKLIEFPYNRELAVAYAHRWAYGRNPEYFDFQGIGGDCTNFASQCIYGGRRRNELHAGIRLVLHHGKRPYGFLDRRAITYITF